jgi:hypothetical protein
MGIKPRPPWRDDDVPRDGLGLLGQDRVAAVVDLNVAGAVASASAAERPVSRCAIASLSGWTMRIGALPARHHRSASVRPMAWAMPADAGHQPSSQTEGSLPGAKKAKDQEGKEPAPVVVYKEDCDTNFRGPTGSIRQSGEAARLVTEGDAKIVNVSKASSPEGKKDLILGSIDKYRAALTKDPYDAEATLKLALAYDMTLRKGCALALLRRLETLSNSQQFRAAAESKKNLVRDNTQWFAGYRKEALQQIP